MEELKTMYGRLKGVHTYDCYLSGSPHECELRMENIIVTDYGSFVPQYSDTDNMFERTKKHRNSIIFFENGEAKSIALEEQTDVNTPMGIFPAELVTFYDDGSLNRVFPLNGQISGYWSEEDEGTLAKAYDFKFDFATFSSKIISLRFYPTGELRSLTLWPGSVIKMETPAGTMEVRTGFSLYKSGRLKSVEPAKPKALHTKIGSFLAFDDDALGLHADSGSIGFSESGNVTRFTTAVNALEVTRQNGMIIKVSPREVLSYVDITETVIMPLKVRITEDEVIADNGMKQHFKLDGNVFKVTTLALGKRAGCTDCSSCDACG